MKFPKVVFWSFLDCYFQLVPLNVPAKLYWKPWNFHVNALIIPIWYFAESHVLHIFCRFKIKYLLTASLYLYEAVRLYILGDSNLTFFSYAATCKLRTFLRLIFLFDDCEDLSFKFARHILLMWLDAEKVSRFQFRNRKFSVLFSEWKTLGTCTASFSERFVFFTCHFHKKPECGMHST